MSAAKKSRKPANDIHSAKARRVSYVVLPNPRAARMRMAALGVLGLFALGSVLAVVALLPTRSPVAPVAVTAPAPLAAATVEKAASPAIAAKTDSDGIALDASALAPLPEQRVAEVAENLPPGVIDGQTTANATDDNADDLTRRYADQAAPQTPAARQDALARTWMLRGDARQALRHEYRAAQLDPANMLYRLGLAILYDQNGDSNDAAILYRQVAQAYRAGDASLPPDIGIDAIQRRVDYLASLTPRR